MSLPLLRRVLTGDADAIEAFGDGEICAVIDWRAGLPEMAEEIAAKLPDGHFKIIRSTTHEVIVQVGSRAQEAVPVGPEAKQEELLLRLDGLLHPEYEMRQFRPFDGDSYSLYIAEAKTWSALQHENGEALEKYFLTIPRLAAYWKKSYLARLFSKP
jgi:hypothetical protein